LQIILPDQLRIQFRDGEFYTVSLAALLANNPDFAPLKVETMFATAQVSDVGSIVVWKCGLQIDSVYLYQMAKVQAGQGFPKIFRKTVVSVIFLLFWACTSCPVEPKVPADSELLEVDGMPKYIGTDTGNFSGWAFKVNGMLLNCDLNHLGGPGGGCDNFRNLIDLKKPVRATYFWQPSRLWYHYKVLNSLEQDGKIILSSTQLRTWFTQYYGFELESYRMMNYLLLIPIFICFLLEMFAEQITKYLMEYRRLSK
jgi:hypothetical protein